LLKQGKIQTDNIQILIGDPGLTGGVQICAIIFPMAVLKEEVGMKEESCGT